jgi:hypothetical protein
LRYALNNSVDEGRVEGKECRCAFSASEAVSGSGLAVTLSSVGFRVISVGG